MKDYNPIMDLAAIEPPTVTIETVVAELCTALEHLADSIETDIQCSEPEGCAPLFQ